MKIIFLIFLTVSCFSCSLLHNSKNTKDSSKSMVLQKNKQTKRKLAGGIPLKVIKTLFVRGIDSEFVPGTNVPNRNNNIEYHAYISEAKQGNLEAQYNLGVTFYWGRGGVVPNYKQAARWFQKAAHQGDAKSQYNLGVLLRHGTGISRDDKQAFNWYKKAALQGLAKAQNNLGMMFYWGEGKVRDFYQAAKWYQKAAHQGDALAQYNLGVLYETGSGVMQDDKQAFNWIEKAALQGLAKAQFNLGVRYDKERDHKQAFKWYKKAALQGDAIAQNNLGELYANGKGVTQDETEAYVWFHLSEANGYAQAKENINIANQRLTPEQLALAQRRSASIAQQILQK